MNWDALSAIAGAVGALGVIVTLLYLALQVRHATRVAKADFFFRSIEGWIDFNLRVADNEELSELLWKTLESPGELSRTEELRSRHLLSGIFRIGERLYYGLVSGQLTKDEVRAQFFERFEEEGSPLLTYLYLVACTRDVEIPERL